MIERLIFIALRDGIAELQRDPKRLEIFFREQHDLSDGEIAILQQFFKENPPNIIHNYPRDDSSFPLYAIVLGSEQESTKFLDDFGGMVTPEEAAILGDPNLAHSDIRSSIYTHVYNIFVHAQNNPDVVIWYYELAKYFLTRARTFFKSKGLLDTHFAGGDIKPSGDYLHAYLFGRQLVFTCQREQAIIDAKPERAFEVEGIFVSDNGEFDEGGVRTLVKVGE